MNRKERRARAEQKKQVIREEIFKVLCGAADLKNLNPTIVVNKAINIMKQKNPQEKHFIESVCSEIRDSPREFTEKMLTEEASKYQTKT